MHETRERLKSLRYGVLEPEDRDYGQAKFFLIDDDDYSQGLDVPIQALDICR